MRHSLRPRGMPVFIQFYLIDIDIQRPIHETYKTHSFSQLHTNKSTRVLLFKVKSAQFTTPKEHFPRAIGTNSRPFFSGLKAKRSIKGNQQLLASQIKEAICRFP